MSIGLGLGLTTPRRGSSAPVDVLQATLRVASGEAHTLTEINPVGSFDPGTVSTMADGNDATGSFVRGVNEGAPPSITYREEWTLDTAAVAGGISFVRVIARNKLVDGTAGLNAQGTYRPSWGGADRGAEHAVGAVANDDQDFSVDPADGQPWTNAKINALKWGWFLRAFVGTDSFDDTIDVMCVDFKLELWGP